MSRPRPVDAGRGPVRRDDPGPPHEVVQSGGPEDVPRDVGFARHTAAAARQWPHEFSGGMRQRIMIAWASCCGPASSSRRADDRARHPRAGPDPRDPAEPGRRQGIAVLLITHNIGRSQRSATVPSCNAAKVVEVGSVEQVLATPAHPYTQGSGGVGHPSRPRPCRRSGVTPRSRRASTGMPFPSPVPPRHGASAAASSPDRCGRGRRRGVLVARARRFPALRRLRPRCHDLAELAELSAGRGSPDDLPPLRELAPGSRAGGEHRFTAVDGVSLVVERGRSTRDR